MERTWLNDLLNHKPVSGTPKESGLLIDNKDVIDSFNAVHHVINKLNKNNEHLPDRVRNRELSDLNSALKDISGLMERNKKSNKVDPDVNLREGPYIAPNNNKHYDKLNEDLSDAPLVLRRASMYIDKNWESIKNYVNWQAYKNESHSIPIEHIASIFSDKQKLNSNLNDLADNIEQNKAQYRVAIGLAPAISLGRCY